MLSKILNIKTLVVILVAALAILLITQLTKKEDRTFKSELVTVDTSQVTKIQVIPKSGSGDDIFLTRTGQQWILESAGKQYQPDRFAVQNILAELLKLKPERVAATDDSRWDEFQVTDSTGTRVKLYKGKKEVADVYIGKFSYSQPPQAMQNPYQQNRGKMATYVRLADEDEVYIVDGFVKMNIQTDVNSYRDKLLCSVKREDLTRLTFQYPGDSSFTLEKGELGWTLNGTPTDSTKTVQYLNKLGRVTSNDFLDDADITGLSSSHYVRIEGNNIMPVEIRAFPADSVNRYIMTSSANPDAKFSGEKSKLFERVFTGPGAFFKMEGQD